MPQFSVYKNKNAATRARFPFLFDTQSDREQLSMSPNEKISAGLS